MLSRRKKIGIALLVAIVALIAAIPYLFPLSSFIPKIEAAISERVHQPVTIGSLRLFLMPLPYLEARKITVGKPALLEVDSLQIHPHVWSLVSSQKRIRSIRLNGVRAKPEVFAAAGGWIQGDGTKHNQGGGGSGNTVRIDRISLRNGEIRFDNWSLSALGAEVLFDAGKLTEVRATQGESLRVAARPQNSGVWKLAISAHDWTVPVGLPVTFTRLEGEAVIDDGVLRTPKLSGNLYGGTLNGGIALSWKPEWSIEGESVIQGVDVEPLAKLINPDLAVSGRLTARPVYKAKSSEAKGLRDALVVESKFSVEKGTLQNIDLVAAASNPFSKSAGKGGKTEFDQLSGQVEMNAEGYEFTDLKLGSGLFKASGDLDISKDHKLDGLIAAEVKGTASLVSIPFDVSGNGRRSDAVAEHRSDGGRACWLRVAARDRYRRGDESRADRRTHVRA